jgi:hypothetical protein
MLVCFGELVKYIINYVKDNNLITTLTIYKYLGGPTHDYSECV